MRVCQRVCFEVNLAAHFIVWLSQSKTRFLDRKMVWANWDVEELETWAEDITIGKFGVYY